MAAIALLLAAMADRGEARSQPAAIPQAPVFKQGPADDKRDDKKEVRSQQQLSKQELAGRNPHQVQQQERVERLQSRL